MRVKGKKRAAPEDESDNASETFSTPEDIINTNIPKKLKRAVTKQCPVCQENIPLRLLASHSQLELQRVEEMSLRIPSPAPDDVLYEIDPGSDLQPGPSIRRAAIRARQSIAPKLHTAARTSAIGVRTTSSDAESTIRLLQRNRRARHTKTKELSRAVFEDLDGPLSSSRNNNNSNNSEGHGDTLLSTCPVCRTVITGESVTVHVDRCLAETAASEAFRNDIASVSSPNTGAEWPHAGEETYQFNGETRIRVTALTGFAGTGFSIRDRKAQDVDDELDIEGEDEDVFGDAQFTECDILPLQPDEEVDIEDDDGDGHGDSEPGPSTANNNTTLSRTSNASSRGRTLRDLVAAGKVAGHANSHTKGKAVVEKQLDINESVKAARDAGDTVALLHALERKIKALESSHPSSPHVPNSNTSALSPPMASPTCRICLESYADPTVSVACWHVFCDICWLRCLGTTKLCPICKHITAASNLRKIYL